MQKYLAFPHMKVGTVALALLAISAVLLVAPRKANVTEAFDCADVTQVPSVPTFNPFTVDWSGLSGSNCTDAPTLSVKRSGQVGGYVPNISGQNGDQFVVSSYIHNGARQDIGDADTAYNITATFNIDPNSGSVHVTLNGQDGNGNPMAPKTGDIQISMPSGSHLEVVSGTGVIEDHLSNPIGGAAVDGGSSFTVNLGSQKACFDFSRFLNFTVRIVGNPSAPVNPSGHIAATIGGQSGAQCLFNGTVTWSTQNVQAALVTVIDPDTGAEKPMTSGPSGSQVAPWIQPNKNYIFKLYDTDNNQKLLLDTATLFTSQTCGTNPPPAPSKTTPTLTITNFCVGQVPTYTVTYDPSLAGGALYWSSTAPAAALASSNGQNESNANYGQILDGSGTWTSAGGRAWATNDIGSWSKRVGVLKNGQPAANEASFNFTVSNCGSTPPPAVLQCVANPVTASVFDTVYFTATGGNGSYVWGTSNNSNAGNGNPFGVSFQSPGTKVVTVTSGGQTVNCNVTINGNVNSGNCNNSSNSCNDNNNTNGQTSYGNNSANQNNQNNINGNNNVVTNTNNNCVNNSCNYNYTYNSPGQSYPVYVNSYTPPVTYTPPITVYPIQPPQVLGGSVNLSYSKRAINNTKNADATSVNASREDFITYTLTVTNNGNTPSDNFVVTDDLSQVLPYADIVDNGGGYINGNSIAWPGISVPAGGSVSESFEVRVKYALADNIAYTMTNTYGNTVVIHINTPQVLGAFTAPKTGADTNAFVFAGLLTTAAGLFVKRKALMQLIFT